MPLVVRRSGVIDGSDGDTGCRIGRGWVVRLVWRIDVWER